MSFSNFFRKQFNRFLKNPYMKWGSSREHVFTHLPYFPQEPYQNNMYKLFKYIRFLGRVAQSKCTPNIANTILHNETNIIVRLFMRITSNAPPPQKNQILMKLCVYTIQLRNEHALHTFHTYIHASQQILFFFRNICSV